MPFDAVLIELFGTADTDVYLASTERDAAELVVACMAEAGFEYQLSPGPTEAIPIDPTSLDDAQERGFGIITGFRRQISEMDLTVQGNQDPNLVYLSTLTAADIDRFVVALNGLPSDEPGQRPTNTGCNGEASVMAYADWTRFFEALPNYTALGEERDSHPDWLAARALWSDCMVERGFTYSEPDAIRSDVISRMNETVSESYPGGQVPLIEVDGRAVLDPDVDRLLTELTDFEQRAAVANVACSEPIASQLAAVEFEVQQAFVTRNQSAIDQLLEAAAGT